MTTKYKSISAMMAARARHLRSCPRTFPKFHEGMSTADYVRQYWGANARDLGIECGYKNEMSNATRAASEFFACLNFAPAAVLNGAEVLEEVTL
jgi:hypothetical protein